MMRWGSGSRVLVCLHGFLGCGRDWEEFAGWLDGLVDGWSVWAPDLPGHGGGGATDADGIGRWLRELLPAARPPAVVLAGYSLGGRLGLRALLDEPGLCDGFVGMSMTAGLEDAALRGARVEADRRLAARLRGCDREGFRRFLREWRELPVFGGVGSDEVVGRFVRERSARDPLLMAECLERWSAGRLPPLWDRLRDCGVPMVFLAGGLDEAYSRDALRMAAAAPSGEARVLPGVGHRLPEVDPAGAARVVAGWLRRSGL